MIKETINILLVEDNPGDARLVMELIKGSGNSAADFTHVEYLQEALTALKQNRFDVVLLDLNLPDCSGLKTIEKITEHNPNVPIVILSGLDDEEITLQSLRRGAQDYLVKGQFDSQLLTRSISYSIERSQAEKEIRRANRALQVISESSQVLVRTSNDQELLQKICDIIVSPGGYALAWVGCDDAESSEKIRILASTAPSQQIIRKILKNKAKRHIPDFGISEEFGFVSSIILPLKIDEKTEAKLYIYSNDPGAFSTGEMKLLTELADDIVFGLNTIRTRAEKNLAERQILEISSREQRRIGQDLHDILGQNLTGISFLAKSLETKLKTQSHADADTAAKIAEMTRHAISQARSLSRGLVPVDISAEGLMDALKTFTMNTSNFFDVACGFLCPNQVLIENNTIATHLYHIAREAVSNAIKHGKAKKIAILLDYSDNTIVLRITDNGTGISMKSKKKTGIGISIMNYRARMIGGELAIEPNPKGGTIVECTFSKEADRL
jgi:signal transduction histidine kinase